MSNLTIQDRQYLHWFLTKRFNLSELKTLAYVLGFPFEEYQTDTISAFAREILQYYERENNLGVLLKQVLAERPDSQLAQIYARQPAATPRVKVELVIRNAVTENAKDIQERIAKAMGWRAEDVGIIMAAPGSLKLLLSVPADKVPELLSLARDPQAWLPYEVQSISPYEQLPRTDQEFWRKIVMEQAKPLIPVGGSGLGGASLVKWIVILIIVAVGVVVGSGIVLAPRVEVVNACRVPIGIPPDVPVVGGQEMMPGDSITAVIPTGNYHYIYTGAEIEFRVGNAPFLWPVGNIEVLVNGNPLRPGDPQTLRVELGDWVIVELYCE